MTVQDTSNRNDAIADGVQTVFAYSFLLLVDSHMFVFIDGVATPTGWTVDGVGNPTGGNVTFAVAPANGVQVTLIREVPYVQEIDYVEYDPFPAEVAETGLDLAVMRDQQLNERADRSLHYDVDGTPPGGATLPDPVAFQVIGYDADGELTNVNVGAEGGNPVRNPRFENQDSAGFDLTDVGNLTADSAAIAGTLTADTLAATTGLQVRGEPVANTVENDATYDPIGAAATVQGNLDTHTGDADIHYSDVDIDGKQYAREDKAWVEVFIPPGTITSDTAPVNPLPNQLWYHSVTGKEYIWYTDGDSSQWVHTGPAPVGEMPEPSGMYFVEERLLPGLTFTDIELLDNYDYEIHTDSCFPATPDAVLTVFADDGGNTFDMNFETVLIAGAVVGGGSSPADVLQVTAQRYNLGGGQSAGSGFQATKLEVLNNGGPSGGATVFISTSININAVAAYQKFDTMGYGPPNEVMKTLRIRFDVGNFAGGLLRIYRRNRSASA